MTFATLAVVLTLQSHADETSPGGAASTLAIAVVGTLLAVFVADLLSHLTVHSALPTAAEFRHMTATSAGSITVLVLPLSFLLLAGLGVWSTPAALNASAIVLIATLVVVCFLAVRRITLPVWQKLVILLAEAVLGIGVIALELLAHA